MTSSGTTRNDCRSSSIAAIDVSTDHHTEYLAKAIDALSPEGRNRVDELLEQLAEVVGDHDAVASFAAAREAEVDAGGLAAGVGPEERALSPQELDLGYPASGRSVIRSPETTSRTGRTPS